jgi:hypothetical protein
MVLWTYPVARTEFTGSGKRPSRLPESCTYSLGIRNTIIEASVLKGAVEDLIIARGTLVNGDLRTGMVVVVACLSRERLQT